MGLNTDYETVSFLFTQAYSSWFSISSNEKNLIDSNAISDGVYHEEVYFYKTSQEAMNCISYSSEKASSRYHPTNIITGYSIFKKTAINLFDQQLLAQCSFTSFM